MSDSDSKHRRVGRELEEGILSGRLRTGARLPSEAQLVRQHGVSRPTVIRALNDLEARGLIDRRKGAGSFVRSKGNARETGRQLGLLIPGLGQTEIFELICGELASLARAEDFGLLWGGSEHPRQDAGLSLEQARQICDQFAERQVDGVFFAPFELIPRREEANREIGERLRQAGIPVVLVDRDLGPFPKRSDFDLVGLDNMAAGYLLAEHFVRLGCERIAFVARPHSASTVDARIAGVREALARHGLDRAVDWVHVGDPGDRRFVRGLMAGRRWDALLCANDHTAAELLRLLMGEGYQVPGDVRLAGFDNVRYATLLARPLTTIHQPCREIAVAALRAMQDRLAMPSLPPRSQLLTPTLVIRETCGTYPTTGVGKPRSRPR
ncbi:MAG: substrate-binding domain-containing protein [Verrucomicrobiales bacterium]|nr:substrate-binding domain-containing protein [Verrucomicrobiales bacterium]